MHTGVQSFAKIKSALSQVNPTPSVCVCVSDDQLLCFVLCLYLF